MGDIQLIGMMMLKMWWVFVGCGLGAIYGRHIIKDMEE